MSCIYGISIEKDDKSAAPEGSVAYKVRLAEDGSQISWKFMDADGGSISTSSFAEYENVSQVNRHEFVGPASLQNQTPECQMGWLMNHVPAIFKMVRNLQSGDIMNFQDKDTRHQWNPEEWKKIQGAALAEAETLEQWDQLQEETPAPTQTTSSHLRL